MENDELSKRKYVMVGRGREKNVTATTKSSVLGMLSGNVRMSTNDKENNSMVGN